MPNSPWALRLNTSDAHALAALRMIAGIEVAESGDELWLRGRSGDERLETNLRALPARERYECVGTDQLRALGQRIPATRIPDLMWQPLVAWLRIEPPACAPPAAAPSPVSLRLVRSTQELESTLLLSSFEVFRNFALAAAKLRLDRLSFAVESAGRVLVRGTPLPPLPGVRFTLHGSVAVPAGLTWAPAVGADVVARCLGASAGNLVLWTEDGHFTRLHSEQFIPVTRSAVRATEKALFSLA